MAARVQIDYALLRRLRQVEGPVLADLLPVARQHVESVLGFAQVLVPRGEVDTDGLPPLASSTFVDEGINAESGSAIATAGYEHPNAGPIHEGWHHGAKVFETPPEFLRIPFRALKGQFRGKVAKQVLASLKKHFPSS